jgi:hypothetical protein
MPINSRNKGAQGEREVIQLIDDLLGIQLRRNLDQWREGGFDLIGLEGWAIEVKRAKKPLLKNWWQQTVDQANLHNLKPVLFYRLDNQRWRVVLAISQMTNLLGFDQSFEMSVEISPECFAAMIREKFSENLKESL